MYRSQNSKPNLIALAARPADDAVRIAGTTPEVGFDGVQEKNIPWRGNRT
jgi:hypothetical protein